jgi:hypothetical protein
LFNGESAEFFTANVKTAINEDYPPTIRINVVGYPQNVVKVLDGDDEELQGYEFNINTTPGIDEIKIVNA